jgi:hypothetical protein
MMRPSSANKNSFIHARRASAADYSLAKNKPDFINEIMSDSAHDSEQEEL